MAAKKGKSEQRIKDWQQRYHQREEYEDQTAPRQRTKHHEVKLPPRELSAGAEGLDDLPRAEGMVIGQFPGGAIVLVGTDRLLCAIAGTFRPPQGASALAVGDVVTVAIARSAQSDGDRQADKDRADAVILARQPRRTVLSRPRPRSRKRNDPYQTEMFEKVIAANMDVLLIVASTRQPPLRHGLIDRCLIIAERGELAPLLAVNKVDLGRPSEAVLESFRRLELEIVLCSAVTGEGIDELRRRLGGRRGVLAGASGVGKSTLINALVPGAQAATQEVRAKDERGRHTTSSAEVYDLPGGGMLVDTPGLRELGIALDAAELPWFFPEFEQLAGQCRFHNCTHTHEPAYAVIQAAAEGRILPRRYESYLNILQTLADRRD